ncbi:MAG: hypothetical protein RLZZ344_1039, partial [Pseudomonadota bacterium]
LRSRSDPAARGDILIIESGLLSADAHATIVRALPPVMLPAAAEGLRMLHGMPHHDLDDPWKESDSAVMPGALRAYAAALEAGGLVLRPNASIPWAAWSAIAEGLEPAPDEFWIQLLPCRLGLSAQAVGLIPLGPNGFSPIQVETMARRVEQWPATLVQSASGAVFLRSPQDFGVTASAPEMLGGLHLAHHPPIGHRSRAWRQMSSEIEMAFHQLAEDEEDPCTAQMLWPWGGGRLPTLTTQILVTQILPVQQFSLAETAPPAIRGLHQWLATGGYGASLRCWQPHDIAFWVDAWQEALAAVFALSKARRPWALLATDNAYARLWAASDYTAPGWFSWSGLARLRRPATKGLHAAWADLVTRQNADDPAP